MEYVCYGGGLTKEITRYFVDDDSLYDFTDRVMWDDRWTGVIMLCERTGHEIYIEKGAIIEN